jgi:hypothetical protein
VVSGTPLVPSNRPPNAPLRWIWHLLILAMPMIIGCDGCRLSNESSDVAQDDTEKRPPFTSRAAQAYPVSRPDSGTGGMVDGVIKPGHWATFGFSLRSNRDDQRGVVRVDAEAKGPTSVFVGEGDGVSEPVEVAGFRSLPTQRPVVLPKGQLRRFDTRLLAPMRLGQLVESIQFQGEFSATDSSSRFLLQPSQFSALAAQTYFFTILTDRPERFTRLQTADWVRPYRNDLSFSQTKDNYRIVIPATEGLLPIAETALDWTSTAVLFWDDVPVRALTPNQINAIIDWLHFGGTLIVNGPSATDALSDQSSQKLKNYLAINNDGSEEMNVESMIRFLRSHTIKTDKSVESVIASLADGSPKITLAGQVHSEASALGEEDILIERRIGRGRLVQSRVDLMSPWLTSWKSYDSFFNAAILARPSRVYQVDREALAITKGIDDASPGNSPQTSAEDESAATDQIDLPPLIQRYVASQAKEVPPAINSGLRFASRDSMLSKSNADEHTESNPEESVGNKDSKRSGKFQIPVTPEFWTHPVSGLGGWNDDSPILAWSRQQLSGEIGLVIPDSKLVFRSLLIYLVVLVPINYLIFRLLGRLEWAWVAVVPLSILGAVYVAKAAQLDVGFARSRNEIAMLEIPRGHDRGHLTRVLGLYNSLASQYQFEFDNPDAAISLIDTSNARQRNDGLFGSDAPELRFGYQDGIAMGGVSVGSNSYRALHIEQIVDLEGPIGATEVALQPSEPFPTSGQIRNQTGFDLLDTFLIERNSDGGLRVASLGEMPSGSKRSYALKESAAVEITPQLPMGMSDLMLRLMSVENIESGSVRLIARTDQLIEGLTIAPDCQQIRSQTVVLAHLRYPRRPELTTDQNLPTDLAK